MAKAPAAAPTADAPPQKKGPSLVVQLGALLVMTAAAAGMGWMSGGYLTGGAKTSGDKAAAAAPEKPAASGQGDAKAEAQSDYGAEPASDTVIPLAGMTTNLAAPADVWLRMELSIVVDKPLEDKGLPDVIHQDLLAYVRTLKMHQIEGASGFQHFRADLLDRASIRSNGLVKQVLIRTLLFE